MTTATMPLSPATRAADLIGGAFLLLCQIAVAAVAFLFSALMVMGTAYCSTSPGDGYTPCGSSVNIEIGLWIAGLSGFAIAAGVLGLMAARMVNGRKAWQVAAIGLGLQILFAIAAVGIASQALPQ